MEKNLIARASTVIDAPRATVWNALVNPELIKQCMFGTNVVSDWREGSPIVWRGEWQGGSYEDKGVILQVKPRTRLQYLADEPQNYHTVTVELSGEGNQTRVTLAQDKNASERAREHSEGNWSMMLAGLKGLLES